MALEPRLRTVTSSLLSMRNPSPGDLFDMIHIYDAAPVAGKKAFHSVKNLLKFLESHVRAYDTGIGCMYLNGVAVSIHIENAAYRNLYRSSVRNQFDVSGIL